MRGKICQGICQEASLLPAFYKLDLLRSWIGGLKRAKRIWLLSTQTPCWLEWLVVLNGAIMTPPLRCLKELCIMLRAKIDKA